MPGMTASRHLTFANVTSALALTVALGTGGAYAASQLPTNSVSGKQIKNSSVTGKDVKDGSLLASDFAPGQLPAGPPGAPGAAAVTVYAAVIDINGTLAATLGASKGAVSISDPAGDNHGGSPYVITFNRNLTGCVASATVGISTAPGTALIGPMEASISGATVSAFSFDTAGAPQDASFMVAVFC
jgi:hypothetical protein